MVTWTPLLNDSEPDCCIAACGHAVQLWTGKAPSDAEIQTAQDQFSGLDSWSKPLWGWWRRGIGGHRLGGFARIRPAQIPDAVQRFGCAYVCFNNFQGVSRHCVLQLAGGFVSWGKEYSFAAAPLPWDIDCAWAIAPRYHPILLWWTIRNWFL